MTLVTLATWVTWVMESESGPGPWQIVLRAERSLYTKSNFFLMTLLKTVLALGMSLTAVMVSLTSCGWTLATRWTWV